MSIILHSVEGLTCSGKSTFLKSIDALGLSNIHVLGEPDTLVKKDSSRLVEFYSNPGDSIGFDLKLLHMRFDDLVRKLTVITESRDFHHFRNHHVFVERLFLRNENAFIESMENTPMNAFVGSCVDDPGDLQRYVDTEYQLTQFLLSTFPMVSIGCPILIGDYFVDHDTVKMITERILTRNRNEGELLDILLGINSVTFRAWDYTFNRYQGMEVFQYEGDTANVTYEELVEMVS